MIFGIYCLIGLSVSVLTIPKGMVKICYHEWPNQGWDKVDSFVCVLLVLLGAIGWPLIFVCVVLWHIGRLSNRTLVKLFEKEKSNKK